MTDEETELTSEEYEELENERERVAKEEQPRLPQVELESQLYVENAERLEEVEPPVEPNPDEPEPDAS